jgi:hypothetical protein
LNHIQTLQSTQEGEQQLGTAWTALASFVSGFQGKPETINEGLDAARTQNQSLAQAFQGVPPADLKAAAMLFAMAQVRSSLGRDNVPVWRDLQVLKSLVGNEDPDLVAALDRLAPQAQNGVLTPAGLSNEFAGVANDVINASLTGQDVSIADRAKARLNGMLQVKKDGQLVSGTPAQATLSNAQDLLNQGDLMGAVSQMQTLQGPAAEAANPWITQAQATIMAQQVKTMLTRAMNQRAFGQAGAIASGANGTVQNPMAGVYVK